MNDSAVKSANDEITKIYTTSTKPGLEMIMQQLKTYEERIKLHPLAGDKLDQYPTWWSPKA